VVRQRVPTVLTPPLDGIARPLYRHHAVCGASIIIVKQVKSFSGFSSLFSTPLYLRRYIQYTYTYSDSAPPCHGQRCYRTLYIYICIYYRIFFRLFFFYSFLVYYLYIYIHTLQKGSRCNKFIYNIDTYTLPFTRQIYNICMRCSSTQGIEVGEKKR